MSASVEEISAVKGMTEQSARSLYDYFNESSSNQPEVDESAQNLLDNE